MRYVGQEGLSPKVHQARALGMPAKFANARVGGAKANSRGTPHQRALRRMCFYIRCNALRLLTPYTLRELRVLLRASGTYKPGWNVMESGETAVTSA